MAATTWAPLPAVCVALMILAAGILAGQTLVAVLTSLSWPDPLSMQWPQEAAAVVFLIGMQATIILAVLAVAGVRGATPRTILSLDPPTAGARVYLEAIGGACALSVAYNAVVYAAGLGDLVTDLKPFISLLRSHYWLGAAIAVALGAPLAEELLFRGFLLPALARSRLRYRGAALLTTLAWTALHIGYSPAGIVEVMLMGFYFCWLLWRTGSLRVPLACHIAVNTTITLAIVLLPIGR